MFRVIALGKTACQIVNQLRALNSYDDIKFVYCDLNEDLLKNYCTNSDEYILIKNIAQCRDAIHNDNELMAVLVTDLFEECCQKYTLEILTELWNYADHTYCLAIIPSAAGDQRPNALDIFERISDWSDITVLQDNSMYKTELIIEHIFKGEGMMYFLDILLRHPQGTTSLNSNSLPTGVELSEDHILEEFITLYSTDPMMKQFHDSNLFSFHPSTHEY